LVGREHDLNKRTRRQILNRRSQRSQRGEGFIRTWDRMVACEKKTVERSRVLSVPATNCILSVISCSKSVSASSCAEFSV
jgi:hypothetical protein